jgi:hypothetical protein
MPVTSSPRGARWFCAWTHPAGEFRARTWLSTRARGELLMRLFGRVAELEAA